jgi:hypothetical protein
MDDNYWESDWSLIHKVLYTLLLIPMAILGFILISVVLYGVIGGMMLSYNGW